jgi:hypothetical protein
MTIGSAYGALAVRNFLTKTSVMKMDIPPYLPDLAISDFWLFPKL